MGIMGKICLGKIGRDWAKENSADPWSLVGYCQPRRDCYFRCAPVCARSRRYYLESQGTWRFEADRLTLENFACCPQTGCRRWTRMVSNFNRELDDHLGLLHPHHHLTCHARGNLTKKTPMIHNGRPDPTHAERAWAASSSRELAAADTRLVLVLVCGGDENWQWTELLINHTRFISPMNYWLICRYVDISTRNLSYVNHYGAPS